MQLNLVEISVYVLIAGVSAFLVTRFLGADRPFVFFGAYIAALLGAWSIVNLLHVVLLPQIAYGGVPLITASVGAVLLAALWAIATNTRYRGRRVLPRRIWSGPRAANKHS